MKSHNIQRLIHRSYVLSALLPLFFIEIALLLLYFGINRFVADRHQSILLEQVERYVLDISAREVARINAQLSEVARMAGLLQQEHQRFFAAAASCELPQGEPQLALHANGAYYKVQDNGGASLYYSAAPALTPAMQHKARCSEVLDPLLKSVVTIHPLITQAYLNTRDGMNRIYPFLADAPEQYGPTLDMPSFSFYYLADASHNPARKPVWTSAYLDPAGQGWMLSAVAPVYRGEVLEGVSGVDITIDRFVEAVLNLDLPWQSAAFLVDREGTILAMPDRVRKWLGVAALSAPASAAPIRQTVGKAGEFNLLRSPNPLLHNQMGGFFRGGESLERMQLNGEAFVVTQQRVAATGWRMLTLTPEQEVFALVYELRQRTLQFGFAAIALMVFFYGLFFLILRRKSRLLAHVITEPLLELSDLTTNVDQSTVKLDFAITGISEIDQLNRNFVTMLRELDTRNTDLVESRLRELYKEQEARLLERIAETDLLTQLCNRRKLDEVIGAEIQRAERMQSPFGVVMLDIDHFKLVNDTHGHIAGDNVLKEFARQLQQLLRKTDTLGRWAGEEFLVVCPGTRLEGLQQLAESLRERIAAHTFPVAGHKTASFGVAEYQPGDSITDLVNRADRALYKAKSNGRNRVEVEVERVAAN